MTWFRFLCCMWGVLIMVSAVQANLPTSMWYAASAPVIEDTTTGTCPVYHYDGVVRRPFHGMWLLTVQSQYALRTPHEEPTYKTVAVVITQEDMRPDTVEGPNRVMGAWLIDATCNWEPGIHRVLLSLTITPEFGLPRIFRLTSNLFTVRPDPSN